MDQRIARLNRWIERRNDRPLLGFYASPQYPLHQYSGSRKHLPNGIVRPEDVVVADYLDDADRLFNCHEEIGGDLIWSAAPFYGLPWVEASLGCGVVANFSSGSTRSLPPAGFAYRPEVPEFSPDNPWVSRLLEFIPALQAHSAGRYAVGVTLMRGISDLLSALYGGEEFVLKMLEAPEEVRGVVEALTEYWIAFGRCLLDHLELFHGGMGSFFHGIWCPGRVIWTQEDAVALLSPSLYEEFILPADRRIAAAFERIIIHLHPARLLPVDQLLDTDVDAIEIHLDRGGPTAEELYPAHRKVLERKPLLICGDLSEADLDFVLTHLPHRGLLVSMVVSGVDEARRHWSRLEQSYPESIGWQDPPRTGRIDK